MTLAGRLAQVVAGAPGRLSVSVIADDGWTWDHDAVRVVPSASTIKVPILLAVLDLVEQGRLQLDVPVAFPPAAERVGGSGPMVLLPSVEALPLVEALRLMVALSDNDATNAVIDHAGLMDGSVLEQVLDRVPTRHTRLRRRLMDLEAAARGVQNETCAADLSAMLAALRRGAVLAPGTTETALEILRAQQFREGLPAYLPVDVDVASKTGDLVGLRADMALLERRGRWVCVAVLADGLESRGSDRGTGVLPVFAALGALAAERIGVRAG